MFDWQGTMEILAQASLLLSPASSLHAAQCLWDVLQGDITGHFVGVSPPPLLPGPRT